MECSGVAYMVLVVVMLNCHFCSLPSLLVQAVGHSVTCQSPSPSSCRKILTGCVPDQDCYQPPDKRESNIAADSGVHECPSGTRSCSVDSLSSNPGMFNATSLRLSNVSAVAVSLDPEYFSLNVSWALSSSSEFGGFEVRVLELREGRRDRTRRCVCVQNDQLEFDFINLQYKPGVFDLHVTVLPFPVAQDLPEANVTVQTELPRPNGCADAFIGDTVCNTRYYDRPVNVVALSSILCNGTKQMEISWDPPSNAREPPTYYVYINVDIIFEVDGATSVNVSNLNASLSYEVQVQAYSKCSGLGNYLELDGPDLGCGKRSLPLRQEEIVFVCESTPTSITSTDTGASRQPSSATVSTSAQTDAVAKKQPSSSLAILVCTPTVSFILIVVLATSLFLLWLRHRCRYWEGHSDVDPGTFELKNQQVLVFYCSTTPQKDTTYIQTHVVSRLAPYFDVLTPDAISKGNVSAWLEEAVQAAKAILLVCNKELCIEWAKEDRGPSLNALHYLISAAVSSKCIDKFGIVVMSENQRDRCIPDNYYLQLMPVFLMRKGKHQVEEIYKFVTHMKTFQFASTGSTPTTEGPAHVAICSVE